VQRAPGLPCALFVSRAGVFAFPSGVSRREIADRCPLLRFRKVKSKKGCQPRDTGHHIAYVSSDGGAQGTEKMLNDREKILTALREKPLKVYEVMRRANLPNEEACQSLLLKMREEGAVKFDIHKGRWFVA
jgi:hypothetical protein